jgi:D-glycero-D-manno-heptose 1,7-bisphosphate phosphatase
MNKGLFLDRDGVVNFDYKYVHTKENFSFRPEIFQIVQSAKEKRFKIIIVTNQGGIGRGLYTIKQFQEVNHYMIEEFMSRGIIIDKVYFCPFHPTHGRGPYRRDSYDRKPNPGMIIKACRQFSINPRFSVMIGDQRSDEMAAYSASVSRYINAGETNWASHAIEALDF